MAYNANNPVAQHRNRFPKVIAAAMLGTLSLAACSDPTPKAASVGVTETAPAPGNTAPVAPIVPAGETVGQASPTDLPTNPHETGGTKGELIKTENGSLIVTPEQAANMSDEELFNAIKIVPVADSPTLAQDVAYQYGLKYNTSLHLGLTKERCDGYLQDNNYQIEKYAKEVVDSYSRLILKAIHGEHYSGPDYFSKIYGDTARMFCFTQGAIKPESGMNIKGAKPFEVAAWTEAPSREENRDGTTTVKFTMVTHADPTSTDPVYSDMKGVHRIETIEAVGSIIDGKWSASQISGFAEKAR